MFYQGYNNFESTAFNKDFTNSFAVYEKSDYHLLCLRVTQKALQLPVFFSFLCTSLLRVKASIYFLI